MNTQMRVVLALALFFVSAQLLSIGIRDGGAPVPQCKHMVHNCYQPAKSFFWLWEPYIWVYRDLNAGIVLEGPARNGKRHGRWVFQTVDGGTGQSTYVNGNLHGQLLLRYPDGRVETQIWEHGVFKSSQ